MKECKPNNCVLQGLTGRTVAQPDAGQHTTSPGMVTAKLINRGASYLLVVTYLS